MKIAHIGPKNYPPSHGGVEKVVYDLVRNIKNYDFHVLVEWPQQETDKVKALPKGFINQLIFIKKYVKINKIGVLHFHKETFIPHAILLGFFNRNTAITIHGCAWKIKRWSWYYRAAFYLFDLVACILVPKVIFVGKSDFDHFSKIIFWKNLYYIPNGIISHEIFTNGDSFGCVYLGRLSPEKNILKLIKMFEKSNQTLTLYGPFDKHNPSYKKEVLEAIKNISQVSYGGVVESDNVLPTLSQYKVFYNLSFSEGMPVSVLEAASVGLHLVLSNIEAHQNLNLPDVNYINPYNPIIPCYKLKKYSIKNRRHVECNFSIRHQVIRYKEIYNSLNKNE